MAPRSRKNVISYFNVMVVGYSGVGKTSFIRTLLETLKIDEETRQLEGMTADSSLPTSPMTPMAPMTPMSPSTPKRRRDSVMSENLQIIQSLQKPLIGPTEKTNQPYTISREIEVSKEERVILTFIDTPGFHVDYLVDKQLNDITKYIERQFDLTLEEEQKVRRNPKAVDTRVHCCLYFIDSNKPALDVHDIKILKRLSGRVNVIPIIGKADHLTLTQMHRLKQSITKDIYKTHKIPVYGIPEEEADVFQEKVQEEGEDNEGGEGSGKVKAPETLDQLIQQYDYENEPDEVQLMLDYLKLIPFTFIAYEDEPETGNPIQLDNIQLGREFGWGTLDCLADKYSDFVKLKEALLNGHRHFLQLDTSEIHYDRYRTSKLYKKRATKIFVSEGP